MTHLVIGYGNTLRSDDGVGQFVAEQVATWNLEQVRSIAVHQLTPELAIEIAQSQIVIFVDAMAIPQGDTQAALDSVASEYPVQCLDLANREHRFAGQTFAGQTFAGHTADPRSLLQLTRSLYQVTPQAYWILIPAQDFSLGEGFSPFVAVGGAIALTKIKEILGVA